MNLKEIVDLARVVFMLCIIYFCLIFINVKADVALQLSAMIVIAINIVIYVYNHKHKNQ